MNPAGISVLVIDDEEAMRDYVRFALEKDGYSVHTAQDGVEGMEMAKKIVPKVIITDLVMPEGEGIEIIREIKSLYPECKIIAMSGATNSETYLAIARHLGAHRVLQKPFKAFHVSSAVRDALAEATT